MDIYGPFYRINAKSGLFPKQKVMYANFIISKVHISSNCAVNSHVVFLESFGILSSPQICHYRNTTN